MDLIHFNPYYVNPEKVIYVQRCANVTRIFLEGGHSIDVPDSDRTVAYQLTQEKSWAHRSPK